MHISTIIKVASPLDAVINTLNKARQLVESEGIDLQVIKTDYDKEVLNILSEGKVDGLIYTNIHVFNAYNDYLKMMNKSPVVFIEPFYHSKYGLYIHKKRQPILRDLEDVKRHKKLKILLATAFSYIAPCDIPRSLILLNKLGLIYIPEKTLHAKKFDITFEDIENPYQLEFIKSSQMSEEFLNNPQKYDLMVNWPNFMKPYDEFIKIASNIADDNEPTDDFIASYAIGLICRQNNKDSQEIKLLTEILHRPEVKKFHFEQGYPEKNYVMITDPQKLSQEIKTKWQKL